MLVWSLLSTMYYINVAFLAHLFSYSYSFVPIHMRKPSLRSQWQWHYTNTGDVNRFVHVLETWLLNPDNKRTQVISEFETFCFLCDCWLCLGSANTPDSNMHHCSLNLLKIEAYRKQWTMTVAWPANGYNSWVSFFGLHEVRLNVIQENMWSWIKCEVSHYSQCEKK